MIPGFVEVQTQSISDRVDAIAGSPITRQLQAEIDGLIREIEYGIFVRGDRVTEFEAIALVKLHAYRGQCAKVMT